MALTERYRQLRETAANYTDAAISADWGRWVPAIKDRNPILNRALGSNPMARASIDIARRLLVALDAAIAAADKLAEVVGRAAATAGAPKAVSLPYPELPRLQRTVAVIGMLGRVAPSWFDSLRRRELRDVAERGDREDKHLSAERRAMDQTFQPTAFDADALRVADEAQRYQSFLRRLLPGWRRARRALAALYDGSAPAASKALLADAARLSAYHRRRARLVQVGRDNRDDLLATEQGAVDWEGVLINLSHVDELAGLGVLPENAHAELAARRVDQERAKDVADELASQWAVFEQSLRDLTEEFGLDVAGELKGGGNSTALDRVVLWLREAKEAAVPFADAVADLGAVLNAGADVRLDEAPEHADLCRQLSRQLQRIGETARSLDGVEASAEQPEDRDWGSNAALARWVLGFVRDHGGNPPPHLIAVATDESLRQRVRDGLARVVPMWDAAVEDSWQLLGRVFPLDERVSVGITLRRDPVSRVVPWLNDRVADVNRLCEWVTYTAVRSDLLDLDLRVLVDEIEGGAVRLDEAPAAFLVRFYRLWLDAAYPRDPALANFRAEDHEALIGRFRELDHGHVRETYKRIRSRRLSSAPGVSSDSVTAPASSELGVLLRELNKKRRHLPLRQLFARIPTLLLKLKPCVMMSPLSVSTYLHSEDIRFDLVVFDEASQVRPHDGVCAVYRGSQLIVAGDQKQLPPTNFFERQTGDAAADDRGEGEDDEQADRLADFESILDVCSTLGLPRKRLRWHYRSRRESLIAFSNRHFYGDLVTFPSVFDVDGASGVRLRLVENGRWQSGPSGGFNAAEARATADMVIEHARTSPDQSLGVITMNQRQQTLVLEEIEKRRRHHPELEEFFGDEREEPFFVKNLENVQGDERDVIFLSVGYAPDQTGRLAMRFGPLNNEGGERRLNVAVTRARLALTLVSSIRSNDIDLSRTEKVGAKLLKAYLDFAERGVAALASAVTEDGQRGPDSEFEAAVADALRAKGLDVRTQVGCGGFRIDLALADPKNPGRYVLGVECDGATYHSSATARDRDRLRQAVLEGLGWRMCRIWSTDWVRDPQRQVARVLAEYEKALRTPSVAPQARPPHTPPPAPTAPANSGVGPGTKQSALPQYDYRDIDEVKQGRIEELVRRVLESFGATDRDDLVVAVARQLGFSRTGKRIGERIERVVGQMTRKSVLTAGDDGRVRLT